MQTSFEEESKGREKTTEIVPEETWEIPSYMDHINCITNWNERIATYDPDRQSNLII